MTAGQNIRALRKKRGLTPGPVIVVYFGDIHLLTVSDCLCQLLLDLCLGLAQDILCDPLAGRWGVGGSTVSEDIPQLCAELAAINHQVQELDSFRRPTT